VVFTLVAGDTAPPLSVTVGSSTALPATGWSLQVLDATGATVVDDQAPAVNAADLLAVIVTHTWQAGETTTPGTYTAQTRAGGRTYPAGSFQIVAALPALYCDPADAGTDVWTVRAAMSRVDRYTGQWWTPRVASVTADVRPGGTCLLGRTPLAVSSVRVTGATTDLPTGSWRVAGNRLELASWGGDILIAGAEPYAGGWANLWSSAPTVTVAGTWGAGELPWEVTEATRLLARWLAQQGTDPAGVATDDEGNVVTVRPGPRVMGRTTGLEAADELLAPLVSRPVRVA
jgi:hypothetical protein